MPETIFLAGGSGLVGLRLIPSLVADGWRVVATTRTPAKAPQIALGAEPIVVDAFDRAAMVKAVESCKANVIVHQLTNLPDGLAPSDMAAARAQNSRIRDEGTRNLIAGAVAAGARRLVAQSIAFAYATGASPHSEDDPLDPRALGVISLERQVLTAPLEGLVLRYGHFYGPGTGFEQSTQPGSLHVDDAARAARLAVRQGAPGVYNIAHDDGFLTVGKARRELGFRAKD
jgi:nucleoside-diphosphate-sugar epimerase